MHTCVVAVAAAAGDSTPLGAARVRARFSVRFIRVSVRFRFRVTED